MLDLCAGLSSSYVSRDMGFSIEGWDAIESSKLVKRVARELYSGKVNHVGSGVESFNCVKQYDVALAGPPCHPWSRINSRATGFKDSRA